MVEMIYTNITMSSLDFSWNLRSKRLDKLRLNCIQPEKATRIFQFKLCEDLRTQFRHFCVPIWPGLNAWADRAHPPSVIYLKINEHPQNVILLCNKARTKLARRPAQWTSSSPSLLFLWHFSLFISLSA